MVREEGEMRVVGEGSERASDTRSRMLLLRLHRDSTILRFPERFGGSIMMLDFFAKIIVLVSKFYYDRNLSEKYMTVN